MKLGTGLFTCQQPPASVGPGAGLTGAERYDEMFELARTIEDAGLDSAWVSEHHFEDDDYLSGVMPALGALAAETDSIELGPCIALAPLYDPVRLAEDAATIDLIADRRLTLGLAIGSNPAEFEQFGISRDERVERLEDTVNVLRAAWSDGPLDYDSGFHDIDPDVSVTPKPDRTADSGEHAIPIMLGGAAKPAVRRAARTADAWVAPSKLSIEGVRKRREDIHRVREKEGLEGDFTTYLLQHGFVADSKEDAWDAMKDGYLYLQRRYAEIFSGEPVDELPDERVQELKDQAIYGTPEQVAAELREYQEALGGGDGDDLHFILRTYYPGVETEEIATCIERLGEEVKPQL